MFILIGIVGYLLIGVALSVATQAESWEFPVTVPFWIVYVLCNILDVFHNYLAENHHRKTHRMEEKNGISNS